MIEVIYKNLEYTDGIVRVEDRIELPMEDIYIDSSIHSIKMNAKYIDNQSPEHNHDILFIASNFEELMNIIFSKKESHSYSSGKVVLNDIDQATYYQYFYEDEDGIGRYAFAGGNMI